MRFPSSRPADGKYTFTLPPDLPVKPDSRLTLVVSAQRDDLGVQTQVSGELDLAPPVYITHLDTDKPMYQPGEVVHYRSLTLDRFSLKPAEEPLRLTYELITPKGARRPLLQGVDGLARRGRRRGARPGQEADPRRRRRRIHPRPQHGRRRIHARLPRGRQPLPGAGPQVHRQ